MTGIWSMWTLFALPPLIQPLPNFAISARSSLEIVEEVEWSNRNMCKITVKVIDALTFTNGKEIKLPVRVVITANDGSHPDGSGRGTYWDGRFYAEGEFSAEIPPGKAEVFISSGPNFIPLNASLVAKPGKEIKAIAKLVKWFSPQDYGWFCGDNHVHVRHDPVGEIKMDEAYAALQARAEGLDYITEADAGRPKEIEEKLSTSSFLYRQAAEIRPGCFVGHANTPGISRPLSREELAKIMKYPLPIQRLCEIVRGLGGIVIYTHTLPLPRLHWMGATESLSDVLLENYADAFDISNKAEEMIWFTLLNLGAKIAASGSTDTALVRRNAIPPGARRVYAYSRKLDYKAIVEAIHNGRTFVTNGGPVFVFFEINGKPVGEVLNIGEFENFLAQISVFHLYPLKLVEVIRNGKVIQRFKPTQLKDNQTKLHYEFTDRENAWYVARAEDERGNWAITSPIYLGNSKPSTPSKAWLIALQIGNFARYVELRRKFFAHVIVTVRGMIIDKIVLMKNGEVIREISASSGNYMPSGKMPVVELGGDYDEGWIWYPNPKNCVHFLGDFPITETGWYSIRFATKDGFIATSKAVYFDANNPNSHQISTLTLDGGKVRLDLRGYGEEMPLNGIKIPFEGDHWWYPKNSFWELEAEFDGEKYRYGGGWQKAREKFG